MKRSEKPVGNNNLVHHASCEIIWHFSCGSCSNWWSYATSDNWEPKTMKCPHCGQDGEIADEENR